MSLRRLLGLSAAAAASGVSGRLRRSLATSATPPPWAFIERRTAFAQGTGPGVAVCLGYPPSVSRLGVPKHLVRTSARPDHDSDVIQSIAGSLCSASSDGLLLLSYKDLLFKAPILARRGAARLRKTPTELAPGHGAEITHFVCNPVTGELFRLPDPMSSHSVGEVMCGLHVGLLTRADGGHDRPLDLRFKAPILAKRGAARLRKGPTELVTGHYPNFTHFVCNPVTGELSRLPDPMLSDSVSNVMCGRHLGLLTRADGGQDGPPDKFAVAELQGNQMVRFLSGTEEWETVAVSPCQLPHARRMVLDDEVVAFGGRLWWLDVTCGAISADPFSDRPELCFVELPRGSVLPAAAQDGCPYEGLCGCGKSKHRRLCVSQGRLRYIEVSQEEPFLLSTFVLDDEGSGWTLQNRLDLSSFSFSFRCPYPWLPLREGNTPQIGFLDPFNHNWVYMSATITTLENTPQVVFVVDMKKEMVIMSSAYESDNPSFVPCVLPPFLGSSQIPSAGKKDVKKKQGLGLVLADSP